ncbi:hypothetical protein DEAC_c00260 [Desulfosporosinus acididurans]|uniref:RsgI N-terminal anti-sigma domain-containing protein n=1 Tax=Desulfosporosinus acididurans TaxID=476652 RepID=A0A0J1FWG4_9FIRM|nr:anti-sigma factor domain-containing protein [Desulfosporosinus acididurans]KLU67632.1 hypothetical protein DEAC_c00260 [Desulfosporosinus acididurans]
MKEARGIVMKTSKKKTILYTEGGDYLEIPTPKTPPMLGQVIEMDLPIHKASGQKFIKLASIAAVLLLVVGLGVFNIASNANTAVAAVVMDTNNSKELLVNRDAKVLKVVDLAHGTQASSSEVQLQGKDIYTSVNLIMASANSQGVFKQGKNLIMASVIPLDSRQSDIVNQVKLRDSMGQYMLANNISGALMVTKTDENTQKTAQSLGMSVNHYLVYKRLRDQGFMVNQSNSSYNDTSHMLAESSTTLNSLFPQESMTIMPHKGTNQEAPNSMGTPMTGEKMPSMSSPESGSVHNKSQDQNRSPMNGDNNQSPPNMMNSSPSSSNQTTPVQPHMGTAPSNSMPKLNSSGSAGSSGSHGMMH